jgi:hypothetical protein
MRLLIAVIALTMVLLMGGMVRDLGSNGSDRLEAAKIILGE